MTNSSFKQYFLIEHLFLILAQKLVIAHLLQDKEKVKYTMTGTFIIIIISSYINKQNRHFYVEIPVTRYNNNSKTYGCMNRLQKKNSEFFLLRHEILERTEVDVPDIYFREARVLSRKKEVKCC